MALSKSVNLAHAQRAVPCDVCEDEVPGEYYCIECKHTLCPPCEKLHRKFTKGHNVVLRSQVGDIHTTILTCSDHGEEASCHCEKCNLPVCIKCVTGKHKGHSMSDLADVLEREKTLLQDDIKGMQRALPALKNHNEEILTEKEKYKKIIKGILTKMEDENQTVMKELKRIQKERLDEIISIQDSHLVMFEVAEKEMKSKIISYENRIVEYEDLIAKNSLPALRNITQGKSPLPEIGNKPVLPVPPTFVQRNLQSIVENLEKLHISASSLRSKQLKLTTPNIISKIKCPVKGYPRICITKEGVVWLGGSESRELVMVNIKGQVLRKRKINNRPYSLAVMDCGDIIISPHGKDSRSVSRLLSDGREQLVYNASPSLSNGVSVTHNQAILICSEDGTVVLTNCDGNNVKHTCIYKDSDGNTAFHAVENADGNIYISNIENNCLVIIRKDGQILSTIRHTTGGQKVADPTGLVVDKMDNILCSDGMSNCVFIIDQNQQMRELVGRSHGIQFPTWLAVDNDNNLWITQKNGTVHVVKYLAP